MVTASLTFSDYSKEVHEISRNLVIDSVSKYWVNGDLVDKKHYISFIQKKFFDVSTKKPTVRTLAPKFIRNNSHRMLNTTKFLDKRSSKKEYSELFLYLFGFNNTSLLTDKSDATNIHKTRGRNSRSINAIIREQKPSEKIKKCKSSIKKIEDDFLRFDYSPEYANPIERLSDLQRAEDIHTRNFLSVQRKIDNINNTVVLLERDDGNYLISQLKAIYDFSGVAIDSTLRQLEEVIGFHKNLVEKKKKFLTIDMPRLLEESDELLMEIKSLRKNKIQVFSDLRSKDSLDNITKKLKKLGDLKVELGKLEGLFEQQSKAKNDLLEAEVERDRVVELISEEMENVFLVEKKVNSFLKEATKRLYGEEYSISLDFNKKMEIALFTSLTPQPTQKGVRKKQR